MPNHGSSLTLPDLLERGWGTVGTVDFADYAGSICLVSFIELTNGWSWLQKLRRMYDDIQADFGYTSLKGTVKIIAVLFRYSTTQGLDGQAIRDKINGPPADSVLYGLGDNANFLILADPDYYQNLGPAYENRMDFVNSNGILGGSDFYWSYIMGANNATNGNQNAVSDKWSYYTTSHLDPVAFSKIVLQSASGQIVTAVNDATGVFSFATPPATPLVFDSTKEYNTRAFVIQRLKNLVNAPRILSTDLTGGSWVNDPADLKPINVWFSKPMNNNEASNVGNYNFGGEGNGTPDPLQITGALYEPLLNALNKATLTVSGSSIKDTATDKRIVLSGKNILDTYGGTPVPPDPMDNASTYQVDVTPPTVTFSRVSAEYVNSLSVSYRLFAADNPGDGVGTASGIVAYAVKNANVDPATAEWVSWAGGTLTADLTLAAGSDGDRNAYAWVRDRAGNVTKPPEILVRIDRVPPSLSAELVSGTPTDSRDAVIKMSATDSASGVAAYLIADADSTVPPAGVWTTWDGIEKQVSHTVSSGYGEKYIYVWVRDKAGNAQKAVVTMELQKARDIVLVLDYSGSMLETVTYTSELTGQGDYSKTYVLKETAKKFIDLWAGWNGAQGPTGVNDRIGMVLFFTGWETWVYTPSGESLRKILTDGTVGSVDGFIDAYGIESAYVYTAMGAGLAAALKMLDYTQPESAVPRRRVVVLITDGRQNRLPLVKVSGATGSREVLIDDTNPESLELKGPDGGQTYYPGADLPVRLSELGLNKNVVIYTLGIGAYAGWQDTILNLAGASGGTYAGSAIEFTAVNQFFDDVLVRTYTGNSPQIAFRVEKVLATNTAEEKDGTHVYKVFLNRTVKSAAISISWLGGTPLSFSISKDGTGIKPDRVIDGAQHHIAFVSFPHRQRFFGSASHSALSAAALMAFPGMLASLHEQFIGGMQAALETSMEPEGQWTITVNMKHGSAGKESVNVPYYLSVLVEERSLSLALDGSLFVVGPKEKLPIKVVLSDANVPVTTIHSINATITHPAAPAGTLLAGLSPKLIASSIDPKREEDLLQAIARKWGKDPKVMEVLKRVWETKSQTFPLALQNPGPKRWDKEKYSKYSAIYANFGIPGIYHIEVALRGIGKSCGSFERILSGDFIVRFIANPKTSAQSSAYDEKKEVLSVRVVPRDEDGNPLGPGWSESVAVKANMGKVGTAIDEYDGTYRIDIRIAKKDLPNLNAQIIVLGVVLNSVKTASASSTKKPAARKGKGKE